MPGLVTLFLLCPTMIEPMVEQRCPIQGKPYMVPRKFRQSCKRPNALPKEGPSIPMSIILCLCFFVNDGISAMANFKKYPCYPTKKCILANQPKFLFHGWHAAMRWHCVNTNSGIRVHHFYTVLAFMHYSIQMTQKQTLTTKGLRNNSWMKIFWQF